MQIPEDALANLQWGGREEVKMQSASLGTKLMLGKGRMCYRKLFLGKGAKEDLEQGLTGNVVLVSQPIANLATVFPPDANDLLEHFIAVFAKSVTRRKVLSARQKIEN